MKALVTGASSGIGRDIARELDKRGYDLVLVSRDREKLEEVKKTLKGKNIEVIPMDLSVEENCKRLHSMASDIDVLINNAGFGVFGNFTETDLDKEISLINTNIVAVHILTKLYLKDMMQKNRRTYFKCSIYCRIYARTINGKLLCIKIICSKTYPRNKRRNKKSKIKSQNKSSLPRTSKNKL